MDSDRLTVSFAKPFPGDIRLESVVCLFKSMFLALWTMTVSFAKPFPGDIRLESVVRLFSTYLICSVSNHSNSRLIEQRLTSHQTHYRLYRGRFLQVIWPNQQCRLKETPEFIIYIYMTLTVFVLLLSQFSLYFYCKVAFYQLLYY